MARVKRAMVLSKESVLSSPQLKQEAEQLYSQVISEGFTNVERLECLAMAMSMLNLSLDPLVPSLLQQASDPVVQGLVLLWLLVKGDHLRFNACWQRWQHPKWVMGLREAWELGGFHRMHQARSHPPHACYVPLVDRLLEEIRHQLADALETSFKEISLSEAAHLLLLSADQMPQLASFCQQRGWNINHNVIHFPPKPLSITPVDGQLMAKELVIQAMGYASRFQQIV